MHIRSLRNSCFSSLLAAWDVSPGETSAPSGQKFHADDVKLDYEQSLFFFGFSAESARAKLQDARNEGSNSKSLSHLMPSVMRVVICVSCTSC